MQQNTHLDLDESILRVVVAQVDAEANERGLGVQAEQMNKL